MAGIRIPGQLLPIYQRVMSTPEGKSAKKRVRVNCGICKSIKYYSICRGITRVASVYACEICRHFYQGLKRKSSSQKYDCNQINKGSCYLENSFNETRCKGCLAMQILDCCPHSPEIYKDLMSQLSEDCQKGIRGCPINADELKPDARGSVGFEMEKDGVFVEVEEREGDTPQFDDNMDDDVDIDDLKEDPKDVEESHTSQPSMTQDTLSEKSSDVDNDRRLPPPRASKENISFAAPEIEDEEEEEEEDDDDGEEASSSTPTETEIEEQRGDETPNSFKISDIITGDLEFDAEEEALVDDPPPLPELPKEKVARRTNSSLISSTKSSERIRRKAKKVDYNKQTVGKPAKCTLYDSNGYLTKSGIDLCDCLQGECPGCHFPCPKCRSPKCGSECRVNRRWYFERIEVEGTKVSWTNKFVKL